MLTGEIWYKAALNGNKITLALGYSHPIEYVNSMLEITVKPPKPTELIITGIDKQLVGEVAANIRSYRRPEPYKGKGIRYKDEHIIRKEGKAAVLVLIRVGTFITAPGVTLTENYEQTVSDTQFFQLLSTLGGGSIVVIMNEAERKIPIQQTGSGLVDSKDHTPYLPLKLNNAGVIPVIFASAIISTPVTIAQIIGAADPTNGFVQFSQNFLAFDT
ncbi:hypothetical protein FQA39_LY12827 [Lamprigera yunnana]|nr:hypothetical protein FQA39_LY12827 [Lamprigera yunnana]